MSDDQTTKPESRRLRPTIQIASLAVLLACLVTIVRVLPVDQAIARLREWDDGQGFAGMAVFAGAYVIAGLAFVPGSALTLASGAVFGVAVGTAVVSVASTTTAALAFLIARHLARGKVEAWARRSPRFSAVDRAIADQGWKIVGLLRLSPALPFSLGNYLYGLTAVRFVPYVLASWIGMLPGTLLYVLIGDAGATGLAAASGDEAPAQTGHIAMLVVGLVATLTVTVLIARAARRALAEASDSGKPASAPDQRPRTEPEHATMSVSQALLPLAAVMALVMTVATCSARGTLASLFGPPQVEMQETYTAESEGRVYDHSRFDALLRAHVDDAGLVDYATLAENAHELDAYVAELGAAPFDELGRNEKLALLINAYNAFTLRLILDHMPIDSIRDIPGEERWAAERWKLAGETYSLDQIEHREIRPNFAEARIHFALVCAAVGCPPLRAEAYTGTRLEEQLQSQAEYVHSRERWFRFDREAGELWLTSLYDWYGGDFRQAAGSIEVFAARYSPDLRAALSAGEALETRFLDYDWSLNLLQKAAR